MKDSQEAIDRVLTGLRDVSTPNGMEQRVLAAMENRGSASIGSQWRSWSVGLAVAVMLVAAVVFGLRPNRVRHDAVAVVKEPLTVPRPAPAAEAQRRNTGVLHSVQNDVKYRSLRRVEVATAEPLDTGGIPAPPMPLTEQERLLLRLAHRADATELTPLNAEARARQNAEFDAEFQEFFAPPVVAELDTNSTEKEKRETR